MPLFGFLKSKVAKKQVPVDDDSDSDSEVAPAAARRVPNGGARARRSISFTAGANAPGEPPPPRRRRAFDMASDAPREPKQSMSFQDHARTSHSISESGLTGFPIVARPGHLLSPDKFCEVALWNEESDAQLFTAYELSTGRQVMVKIYDRKTIIPSQEAAVYSEQKILEKAAGIPGTVPYHAFLENKEHMGFMFAQDVRPSLSSNMMKLSGSSQEAHVAAKVVAPLVLILDALHSKGIIHRTICPNNIIYSEDRSVALYRFDSAVDTKPDLSDCEVQPALPNYRIGELSYMAPEVAESPTADEMFHEVVFKGMAEEELPMYTNGVDIYSLGAMLFQLLTSKLPFKHSTAAGLVQTVRGADLDQVISEACDSLSGDCKGFLRCCLVADPKQRATTAELLEHPWVKPHIARAREALWAQHKYFDNLRVDPVELRSKARFETVAPTAERNTRRLSQQRYTSPNWAMSSHEKIEKTALGERPATLVHNGLANCKTSEEVLKNNPFTF
mmetsp:Transcript_17057/g.43742  ORF Transcript_17057/g.43742 Transcript_17057/m.43742 type:complete len:504 (-) Transcript_17057:63-1574(-)